MNEKEFQLGNEFRIDLQKLKRKWENKNGGDIFAQRLLELFTNSLSDDFYKKDATYDGKRYDENGEMLPPSTNVYHP